MSIISLSFQQWNKIQENSNFPKTIEDSVEGAVSAWVYEHHEVAGRSTDTLPNSKYLYLPLSTRNGTVGVLGLHIVEKLITPEQRRLMEAVTGYAPVSSMLTKLSGLPALARAKSSRMEPAVEIHAPLHVYGNMDASMKDFVKQYPRFIANEVAKVLL